MASALGRLIDGFDVVIENAKPDAMAAHAQADERNPRIVWCALTGFGQSGPNAEHAAHDLSFVAHSGLLAGPASELPFHPAMALALQAGGMAAVIGIRAALLQCTHTGKGVFLEVSLSEP